jgi:hypothetical protein
LKQPDFPPLEILSHLRGRSHFGAAKARSSMAGFNVLLEFLKGLTVTHFNPNVSIMTMLGSAKDQRIFHYKIFLDS